VVLLNIFFSLCIQRGHYSVRKPELRDAALIEPVTVAVGLASKLNPEK
jgi:hypothetical protein